MAASDSEILQEVSDDDLPKLLDLYKEKASWAPHMVTCLHQAIKWKNSEKFKHCIRVYSPNQCWAEDGTIIIVIQIIAQDIIVFTLDDKCTNLHKALFETNLLRYDTMPTVIVSVLERHVSTVKAYLQEKDLLQPFEEHSCFLYSLPLEKAKNLTLDGSPDVHIKELKLSDVSTIDRYWPHSFRGSDKYISLYVEANGGYGIFLNETNEMVAWITSHSLGGLKTLHTVEGHRRRGFGGLVSKVMCLKIAAEGFSPITTILQTNEVSIKMFESIGFGRIGKCTFFCPK